jgi:uncharacterized protein (TIGR04255 family)
VTAEAQGAVYRREYRDPPVAEAIIRYQWDAPIPWNVTTPGLLFEHLRGRYPEEPKVQNLLQADMGQAGSADSNTRIQVVAGAQKLGFLADGGTRILTVSPEDISVHGLPPYEGWEALEARFTEGLTLLSDVFSPVPRQVARVGVRYINRIEIPSEEFQLEEYFTLGFTFPPEFPGDISNFLDRVEFVYPGEPVKLSYTWASAEAPVGVSGFVLDFDFGYFAEDDPIPLDMARDVVRDLKAREALLFESMLRDRLREQFHEIR